MGLLTHGLGTTVAILQHYFIFVLKLGISFPFLKLADIEVFLPLFQELKRGGGRACGKIVWNFHKNYTGKLDLKHSIATDGVTSP